MNSNRTPESIRERAYQLWEQNGRRPGRAEEDWLEAERELGEQEVRSSSPAVEESRVDESVRESFPASDPPATRQPDEPPMNAEAKWAAAAGAEKSNRAQGARRARGSIRRQ
jgi:hypothetical protein